jgi:hypothetical protein
MKFDVQHSTMSPILPFDIIALIIDIVGENNDTNLLKELALVSHSFLQICSKHLFATVELHDAVQECHIASSKRGFVKLLESRPDAVKYIRKLTYKVTPTYPSFDNDDHQLSPILPSFLRTISRLNCLAIKASRFDWNTLDSSLTSALLHLMHLPTINHIDLSLIKNFPISSLTLSVNLHRLDILCLRLEEDGPIVVQSEMMPKIREFRTSESSLLTTNLLLAKRQDGQPAFNFLDLRRLSISFNHSEELNIRYLLQNAKSLEQLHLSTGHGWNLVGLHDILSPVASALKFLDLRVFLYDDLPLAGLCDELEAMAGHNVLEALSFEVLVDSDETEDSIGSIIQKVEKVLVKPGWSALRQVSFKLSIACCQVAREESAKLSEALQSLPDKYLSHLSKLESVAFNLSAYVVKCAFEL